MAVIPLGEFIVIHELREYEFIPEHWPEYWSLFQQVGFPTRGDSYGRLLGAWESALGHGRVRFTHLWEYDSLDIRAKLRQELAEQPRWTQDFIPRAAALVQRQTLSVLNPQKAALALQKWPNGSWMHKVCVQAGVARKLANCLSEEGKICWTTEFSDPNEVVIFDTDHDLAALLEPFRGDLRETKTVELVALRNF